MFTILQHGMDAAILQIVGDSHFCDFCEYKGNNKITELRAILQRESQNS